MTIYVGGLRERLIRDALFYRIQGGLTSLGWFNPNPTGYTNHVTMLPEQVPWDEEVPLNSITVAVENIADEEFEVGNQGYQNCLTFYVDIYGENEALGLQISGDVRDILRGKFTALGLSQPTLDVFDYTMATPSWIFFCDIERVRRDRVRTFTHHWQRYMFTVSGELYDYYGNDADPVAYGSQG